MAPLHLLLKLGLLVALFSGFRTLAFSEPAAELESPPFQEEDKVTEDQCETAPTIQLKEGEMWEPFIQPNYTRWTLLSKGMTEQQVMALMDAPLSRTDQTKEFKRLRPFHSRKDAAWLAYSWTYGWLRFDSPAFPEPFEFQVHFVEGVVTDIIDPFEGELSGKGKPTTPKLVLPHDREEFTHQPRWLDLRWTPVAGVYPMEYEIEVEQGEVGVNFNYGDRNRKMRSEKIKHYTSKFPQLTISYPEEGSGRWRVRAKNAMGTSKWSELRSFLFAR